MTKTTIATSEVQDLSFDEIADMLDTNWAEWFVSFEYNNKQYTGICGACPQHPTLMQSHIIEEIQEV